jgi:hypothetical protein
MSGNEAVNEKLFLVLPADEDFPSPKCRLVSATSKDAAVGKYIDQVLALDEEWLELIYDTSPTASLASRFFGPRGIPVLDEQGEWLVEPEEAKVVFEQNVREFFAPRQDWSDIYLKFYLGNAHEEWRAAMARGQFPQAMVGYILKRQVISVCEMQTVAVDELPRLA